MSISDLYLPSSLSSLTISLHFVNGAYLETLRGFRRETGFRCASATLTWPPSEDVLDAFARPADPLRAFAVGALDELSAIVGFAAYQHLDWKNRHVSIAWGVRRGTPEITEQEIVRVLARFAFNELGLERVEAEILAEDTRVAELLERWGWTREVHKQEAVRVGRGLADTFVYAILRDEWQANA